MSLLEISNHTSDLIRSSKRYIQSMSIEEETGISALRIHTKIIVKMSQIILTRRLSGVEILNNATLIFQK